MRRTVLSILKSIFFPYALKYRLLLILLLVTVIPILLIGSLSYYSIHSILHNKMEKAVLKNLNLEKQTIESMLENLDYASRQLALDGKIGDNLYRFIEAEGTSKQMEYKAQIDAAMSLTHFTNPNLGLMTYYLPHKKQYFFSNLSVNAEPDIFAFPIMAEKKNIIYYGPHPTIYKGGEKPVFSIIREITANYDTDGLLPSVVPQTNRLEEKVYIYMETNFKVFQRMLNSEQYGFGVNHLLLDTEGRVMYTDLPDKFGQGAKLEEASEQGYVSVEGHYLFTDRSEDGWSVVAVVGHRDFNREINQWYFNLFWVGLVTLGLCLLLGWSIWRMIYKPITQFKEDFKNVGNNRFDTEIRYVNIMEYDDLLNKFHLMKERIQDLLREVEQKEKNKRHLEVEKLLYQINPHFLHNTLNTIQWIAAMNKQEEIVSLISTFTRVLHYNLGKDGTIVSIHNEIGALKDYLELQQMRYNHKFNVQIEMDEGVEVYPIPRFLLQPLVENAIYHGFKNKDGTIEVSVRRAGSDHLTIKVEDNGEGMSDEKIQKLLYEDNKEQRRVGLGIGLSYVDQMVRVHYGPPYKLDIESRPGEGTRMIIWLPTTIQGVTHD